MARAKNAPATARLGGGLKCEVIGPKGERILTDMPPALGGAGSAQGPGWLLRGALASCTATVVAMRATMLDITLHVLEISVESESDPRGMLGLDESVPAALQAVRCKVRIGGDASAEVLRELVAWADAHSPVSCTLREPPSYSVEISTERSHA